MPLTDKQTHDLRGVIEARRKDLLAEMREDAARATALSMAPSASAAAPATTSCTVSKPRSMRASNPLCARSSTKRMLASAG